MSDANLEKLLKIRQIFYSNPDNKNASIYVEKFFPDANGRNTISKILEYDGTFMGNNIIGGAPFTSILKRKTGPIYAALDPVNDLHATSDTDAMTASKIEKLALYDLNFSKILQPTGEILKILNTIEEFLTANKANGVMTAKTYTTVTDASKNISAATCPVTSSGTCSNLQNITGNATDFLISRILNVEKLIIHFQIALYMVNNNSIYGLDKKIPSTLLEVIFKQIGNLNENSLLTTQTDSTQAQVITDHNNIALQIPMDYNVENPTYRGYLIPSTSAASTCATTVDKPKIKFTTPVAMIDTTVPVFSFKATDYGSFTTPDTTLNLNTFVSNAFSLSIWIKPTIAKASTLLSLSYQVPTAASTALKIGLTSNGQLSVSSLSATTTSSISSIINLNKWNNVVVTSDYHGISMFINGNNCTPVPQSTFKNPANGPDTLTIGSSVNGFVGEASTLVLYNLALKQVDVINEFKRANTVMLKDIVVPTIANAGMGQLVTNLLKKRQEFDVSTKELGHLQQSTKSNKKTLGKSINLSNTRTTRLQITQYRGRIVQAFAIIVLICAAFLAFVAKYFVSLKHRFIASILLLCSNAILIIVYIYLIGNQ